MIYYISLSKISHLTKYNQSYLDHLVYRYLLSYPKLIKLLIYNINLTLEVSKWTNGVIIRFIGLAPDVLGMAAMPVLTRGVLFSPKKIPQ